MKSLTYILITSVFFGYSFESFSWSEKIQLSNNYDCGDTSVSTSGEVNSDGGGPMCETDYGYVWCKSEEKGIETKNGTRGDVWEKSTIRALCKFRHQHRPDNLVNGWARSRLTQGCQTKLGIFKQKVYRCLNIRTDKYVGRYAAKVAKEKSEAHRQWQSTYKEKLKALLKKFDPLLKSLESNLDLSITRRNEINTRLEAIEEIMSISNQVIEALKDNHDKFVNGMAARVSKFEELTDSYRKFIGFDTDDVKRVNLWTTNLFSRLAAGALTGSETTTIKTEFQKSESSCSIKICKRRRSPRHLTTIRIYQSKSNRILESYLQMLGRLKVPDFLPNIKSAIDSYKQEISKEVDSRNMVFSKAYDQLDTTPAICDSFFKIPALIALREEQAVVVGQSVSLGVLASDMQSTLSRHDAKLRSMKEAFKAKARIRSIAGEINRQIAKGHLSEVNLLVSSAEAKTAGLLPSTGNYSDTELEQFRTITSAAQQTLASIRTESAIYLKPSGAQVLNKRRVREFLNKFDDADYQSETREINPNLWRVYKNEIFEIFKVENETQITPPRSNRFDDLLKFDKKIAMAHALLTELLSKNGVI